MSGVEPGTSSPSGLGDHNVPWIFKIGTIMGISAAGMAGIAVLVMVAEIPVHDASTFLHTNIEILVNTFAVTLGITLLGFQFRAQSYPVQVLMKYIKDRVVCGFIGIFIGLISLNMVFGFMFASDPALEPEIGRYVLLPMMGLTAFALYYLAGYIFFMVEKTHQKYILEYIKHEIEEITLKIERDDQDRYGDALNTPFQIWEQVALKAVADRNVYIFYECMDVIFEVRDGFLDKNRARKWNKFLLDLLRAVMIQCVKMDRVRMTESFLSRPAMPSRNSVSSIMDADGNLNYENVLLAKVWTTLMRDAITYNDDILYMCGEYMIRAADTNMRNCERDGIRAGAVVDFFHAQFSSLVGHAISNDHRAYTKRYLDFLFQEFHHIAREPVLYPYAVATWETIVSHAQDDKNYRVFEIGVTRMLYYVDRILGMDGVDAGRVTGEFDAAMTRLAKRLCAQWDARYVDVLFRKYPSWRAERPDAAWARVMDEAVRRGDPEVFAAGITCMKSYTRERRELGEIATYYPVDEKYEDSTHTGMIEESDPVDSGILDAEALQSLEGILGELRRRPGEAPDGRAELRERFMGAVRGAIG
ncbi:MAG: hypothetical protein MPJ05_04405 [Nitrosopumilus sp.]|nr:hypothetical protein [Nitrosopumilus sp.]